MESILVDVRMTLDSLLMEDKHEGVPAPTISSAMPPPMPASTTFTAPEPFESSEAEPIPEERFYSSVLEQAHEEAVGAADASSKSEENTQTLEEVLKSIQATESTSASGIDVMNSTESVLGSRVGPNYDAMTRSELFTLLEQKGLRAKKSATRNEIIGLLRRSEPGSNGASSTGTENASEPTGSLFPNTGALDGGFPVDLGQSGEALAE